MQKTTTTILANVTAATKTIEAKEKSLIKPVDAFYADGMRSVDFNAPAKGLDRTDYNNLKGCRSRRIHSRRSQAFSRRH
jgi:hypothetical protein